MTQGFFTVDRVKSLSRGRLRKLSCMACGLYKDVQSPKMEPYGNFKKKVMVIGEAPGKLEDKRGKPWQGKAGKLLQSTLDRYGIDLFEDCVSLNAVNCQPLDNRTPTTNELNCCREVKVFKAIKEYNPELIILLGTSALTSFLGHRWKKSLGGIIKWRGWCIPDQEYKAWICPMFHPSYVERMDSMEVSVVWEQDLERSFSLDSFPDYKEPNIKYIENLDELDIGDSNMVAFDYETTGLKPHAKGHRIICASVAYGENDVYVFPMPDNKRHRIPFIELLKDGHIKKIAANMKHEDTWSVVRLGVKIEGWYWDTMLNSHILDNRPGITSLKFQAYVGLGVIDYDSEIAPYLKSKDGRANSINRIYELLDKPDGMQMLLKYCALDSIYEYRIAKVQMEEMEIRSLPFEVIPPFGDLPY